MLIKVAIQKFLEWKSISRPIAGESYKYPLEDFSKDVTNLSKITLEDIILYAQRIKAKYAPATVAMNLTVIRGFIKFWHDRGVISLQPGLVDVPKAKQNPYKAISEIEFNLIDDYLDTEPQNYAIKQQRLIIRFLFETAVRVSELVDLKYRELEKGQTLIQNKKNQNKRWIFWSDKTQELLDDFLIEREKYAGDTLFSTYEGKMSVRCVERLIVKLGKKLGITDLVPHSFRHGRAHYILQKGGGVKDIQNVLGHVNPLSSFRYLHLDKSESGNIARRYL